jgi:drug/metabolite transporter (DMT)-like permease
VLHKVSGRWQLGFALALATSIVWSTLPIGLEIALKQVDPETVTWLRFLVSALILGAWLTLRGQLPGPSSLSPRGWLIVAVSLAGLIGNYLTYAHALKYVSPTVNQTVIQLAPMFLLLGGVVFLHEQFGAGQRAGFVVLAIGLVLFSNQRLGELRAMGGNYFIGVALLVFASVIWSFYGIGQKLLLRSLGAQQLLWILYAGSVIALSPIANPSVIVHVSLPQAVAIGYCCFNTLAGYGAFAAAMEHWEVSRVSAVLATSPIFTLASMWLAERLWPGLVRPEHLNGLAIAGALAVVAGSIVSALGGRIRTAPSGA